jgi:hypothetical protein
LYTKEKRAVEIKEKKVSTPLAGMIVSIKDVSRVVIATTPGSTGFP